MTQLLVASSPGDRIACTQFLDASAITAGCNHNLSTPHFYRSTAAAALPVALRGCTASFVAVILQNTPSRFRIAPAMAFPRINCDTTTVTVLAASAATILSLRVCVCFSFQPSPEDGHGRYLPQCLLPQAARHGQPLCHLSRQDTSHEATLPEQARGQARVTCTSNRPQASVRVTEAPQVKGAMCLFLSPPSKDPGERA